MTRKVVVIMTMYDMDSEYNGEKLTYASLCQELMDEYEEKTGEIAPSEEYFRDKIKNSKNNGVINKLSSLLGTDIEKLVENAAEPKKEKYNLLKLVKLIYYIEKDGNAKCVSGKDNENVRILITDILRKPRLENIKTEYSEKSVYGDCFESLFLKIKSQVPDAEARIEKIEGINDYWEYITNMVFDYVITDKALDTEEAFEESLINIFAVTVYSFGKKDLSAGSFKEIIENTNIKTAAIIVIMKIIHLRFSKTANKSIKEISSFFLLDVYF